MASIFYPFLFFFLEATGSLFFFPLFFLISLSSVVLSIVYQ